MGWHGYLSSFEKEKLNTERLGEWLRSQRQQVAELGFEVTTSDPMNEVLDHEGSEVSPERNRKQENQASRL